MDWTFEAVLALSPDENSVEKAKNLAVAKKWEGLSYNSRAIWAISASSSRKYITYIDQVGPAFKCNCPSRKFPCKHGLSLLLLFVMDKSDFLLIEKLPDELSAWLEKRDGLQQKKSLKAEQGSEKRNDTILKNKDKRLSQMLLGMEDLNSWLDDAIRQGLANIEQSPESFYNNISARMVDSKLGGLEKRIKRLYSLPYNGIEWPQAYLGSLAELFLISNGFKKLNDLSSELKAELLSIAGVNQKKESLKVEEGIEDEWLVMAQSTKESEEDKRLIARRVWLWGARSGRKVLILDFVFNAAPFQDHYLSGSVFKGAVVFYPSSYPLRGILKMQETAHAKIATFEGYQSFELFLKDYAHALSCNPLLQIFPAAILQVTPGLKDDAPYIIDQEKKALKISLDDLAIWKLVSISGGHPIDLFGEWDGTTFYPLSAIVNDRFLML